MNTIKCVWTGGNDDNEALKSSAISKRDGVHDQALLPNQSWRCLCTKRRTKLQHSG